MTSETQVGSFQIINSIRHDWAGEVFSGKHIGTEKEVVIRKISARDFPWLSAAQWWEFVEKSEQLPLLSHPSLLQYLETVISESNQIYIVQQKAPEKSQSHPQNLEDLITKRKKHLSFKDLISAFKKILAGLHYLHSQGFLHRTLHPQSILLDWASTPVGLRITQHGLSELWESPFEKDEPHLLKYRKFTAPELQQDPTQPEAPKQDIYSLGVILLSMVLGRLPDAKDLYPKIYTQHIDETKWQPNEKKLLRILLTQMIAPYKERTGQTLKLQSLFKPSKISSTSEFDEEILEQYLPSKKQQPTPINMSKTLSFEPEQKRTAIEEFDSLSIAKITPRGKTLDLDWHVVSPTLASETEQSSHLEVPTEFPQEKKPSLISHSFFLRKSTKPLSSLSVPNRPLPEAIPESWEDEILKEDEKLDQKFAVRSKSLPFIPILIVIMLTILCFIFFK